VLIEFRIKNGEYRMKIKRYSESCILSSETKLSKYRRKCNGNILRYTHEGKKRNTHEKAIIMYIYIDEE